MKTPVPPPARLDELVGKLSAERLLAVLSAPNPDLDSDYHPWEWHFRHEPPTDVTREEWWVAVRLRRAQNARPTPFLMTDGTRLTYNLPDPLLRLVDDVSARARGQIELPEPVVNAATRDRYLVRSLMEEAITSSQLEGASTSRVRAKPVLPQHRPGDRRLHLPRAGQADAA